MPLDGPTIFAAGAAHLDRRGRAAGGFHAGASNPGTMRESAGGAVFNAALAIRLFGAPVRLSSARGGDAGATRVAAALEQAGVEDLSITWLDRATPTYTAILDHRGDLVAGIADMGLYDLLKPRIFERRHLRASMDASAAILLDANLPSATIAALLARFAGRPGAAIGVSPSKATRLAGVLSTLSALFLSRAEAAAIVAADERADVATLARRLRKAGAMRVVVTDGPREAAILDRGAICLQAPPAVAALRDVTGAGDTLAGVAFQAFVGGLDFIEAARLGMAAASHRISDASATIGSPADRIRAIAAGLTVPRDLHD